MKNPSVVVLLALGYCCYCSRALLLTLTLTLVVLRASIVVVIFVEIAQNAYKMRQQFFARVRSDFERIFIDLAANPSNLTAKINAKQKGILASAPIVSLTLRNRA